MRVVLTSEQVDFQHSMRQLLESACPLSLVRALKDDPTTSLDPLWASLATHGVFGLPFSTEIGGEGGSLFDLALFYQEAGRVLCPASVYHSIAFGVAVDQLGDPSRSSAWVRRLISGDLRGAAVVASPDNAGDVTPRLTVTQHEGVTRFSGRLEFVPVTLESDVLLVVGREASSGPHAGNQVACIPVAQPGIVLEPLRTLGRDRQYHVTFDEVEVPDSHLVSPTDGVSSDQLLRVSNALLALQCVEMVGGAQAVLDRTVDYIKTRHQFGRSIASFQAAQHHVANMRIAIDGARLAAYQAAWWTSEGAMAEREVTIAKLTANEAYKWTTLTAHQLHGGMGYLRETDLPFWSERAKLTELMGGGREIQARRLESVMSSRFDAGSPVGGGTSHIQEKGNS